jgi:hypothetical protein
VRGFGVAPHTGRLARAVRARQGRRRRARVAPVLLTGIVCACVRPSVCARAVFAALARKRRAVSVVAAGAAMALLALAAVAISDSNERTELVYRSSLDNTLNPAAGSGKVRPPIWTRCWRLACLPRIQSAARLGRCRSAAGGPRHGCLSRAGQGGSAAQHCALAGLATNARPSHRDPRARYICRAGGLPEIP